MKLKVTRRKFLRALCAGALGTAAYSRWCEPQWLQVGRHRAAINPDAPELRILHLSDFHASRVVSLKEIDEAVTLGLGLKPDLVCLTGDFITSKYGHFGEYAKILKRLSDAAPAFACLGNHDGGSWAKRWGYSDMNKVETLVSDAGVALLRNASTAITVNDRRLKLVGVGDLWARDLDAAKAFRSVEKSSRETIVLLSHNPDSKSEMQDCPWDLMLCGHTHGGQLWIPLIGAPFAPVRDKRFVKGLRRWRDRWIYVTKGIGNVHGVRLNCPPEVSLLTLA